MKNFYIIFLFCFLVAQSQFVSAQSSEALLVQAGNSEDEKERYRLLVQLRNTLSFESRLRHELDKLLPVVKAWATGRETNKGQYLYDFFYLPLTPVLLHVVDRESFFYSVIEFYADHLRAVYPPEIPAHSPLYPIWCLYRGRLLIWYLMEMDSSIEDPDVYQRYFGEGRRLLSIAAKAYPKNRVVRMYLGEPIPWPSSPYFVNAPNWANHQREALEKLTEIIYFWIDERQLSDGQFGGGWGDDVEMWRRWAPILIGFEDPKANSGQRLLSNGLFAQPHMQGGYTNKVYDVEHTAEDSGDSGTAMMHIAPRDSVWQARALHIATLMRNLWAGRNKRGFLQFKSTYFSSNTVDTDPQKACDTSYHPRVVQPTLLYWQRTGDPMLTGLFSDWMDTWVDATARSENGKPSGILPSAIHWPDGDVGGVGKNWWDPRNHGEPELYRWPSAMNVMTSTLLLTHHMTNDETYLQPIRSMANHRKKYLRDPIENPKKGSVAWCASQMGFLSDTLSKYRLLTGDRQFDTLLRNDADGYVRFRLTGDKTYLEDMLEKTAQGFRYDKAAYTDEVRWTDRAFHFHTLYGQIPSGLAPRHSAGSLYKTVTGDFGNPLYFPMNAVRWKTPAKDIAALVTDHSTKHLQAELFHFGSTPRPMAAEFYLLESGVYKWTLTSNNQILELGDLVVNGQQTVLPFTLPPDQLCVLSLNASKLSP